MGLFLLFVFKIIPPADKKEANVMIEEPKEDHNVDFSSLRQFHNLDQNVRFLQAPDSPL